MPLDALTAKANVGNGTDVLAGKSVDGKFIGAVIITDEAGSEIMRKWDYKRRGQ